MHVKGTFAITMQAEPPYEVIEGVSLGRVSFDKVFSGALDATSQVAMIGARTPHEGSAGYVAMERISGSLEGRRGTFVLQHSGTMIRGAASLTVTVVPDSGTGELATLSGSMQIAVVDGAHHYDFQYELGA